MSDGATMKITRKDKLFAKFRRLTPAADRELIVATLKGAEEIAALARNLAPVDDGDLRESVVAEPVDGRAAAKVVVGKFYARFVEFGTAPHEQGGMFKGTQHPGTRPQPFLFPAYRLLKKKTSGRIGRAMGKAAKAVAAR